MRSVLRGLTAFAVLPLSQWFVAPILNAQPTLPAGEFAIKGRVLGPDGAPAEGAQVLLFYTARDQRPRRLEVRTVPDGSFTADAEPQDAKRAVYALARKPGFALDWIAARPGEAIELKLGANPVTFAGTVKGTDGEPVGGARVEIASLRWPDDYRPATVPISDDPEGDKAARTRLYLSAERPLTAISDAEGRFAIADLPRAASVTVEGTAEGRERFRMGSKLLPAETQNCDIVLAPEAVIAGRVTHEGQPIAGLTVLCADDASDKGSTETAADGTYRLTGLSAGTYNVRAGRTKDLTAVRIGPFTVKAGETLADADIAMIEGAVVKGTVRDSATGEPIKGALVLANSQRGIDAARTDEGGAYALRVPPGTCKVSCYRFGPGARPVTPTEQRVTVTDKQVVEGLDFGKGAKGAAVRGRVVDTDGKPVAGARVGSVVGVAASEKTFESHFPVVTDADGRFELPITSASDSGRWPLLALHHERRLAGLVWLPKGEIPDTDIELRLNPGGWLKGTVVSMDGKPLASVPLNWSLIGPEGLGWGVEAGQTDEKGEFAWGPLPAGLRLGVHPGGDFYHLGTKVYRWVTMQGGDDLEVEPIVLNPAGRTVRGTVLDADQRPVANATVYACGKSEGVRSDADGWWEMTGLPQQGQLWFVAIHPTQQLVAAESLDPDWEVEPGLMVLPPAAATGRLLDEVGTPVPGRRVYGGPQFPIEVAGGGGLDTYDWQRELMGRLGHPGGWIYVRTDAEGRWRAEGLIPGVRYSLSVELSDGTRAPVRYDFIVGPEGTTDAGDLTMPAP
ncbi:MAG: hypothetical protein FJX75_07090 [Armatimonadetes bacterium]|nr:hypothetical protein [Armatimonadota bacterium]